MLTTGWSSTEVESHKKALKLTQDVVDSLRMQIDFRKSWAWAVDQDSKDAWKTIVEHCAQTNKHFKLVLEAKDLGEQMLYSRAHRIGVHRDRLGNADKKFQKLFRRGSWHGCYGDPDEHLADRFAQCRFAVSGKRPFSRTTCKSQPGTCRKMQSSVLLAFLSLSASYLAGPWLVCTSQSSHSSAKKSCL